MLLSDKYSVERGSVYLTGIQALVRLPIDQMRRDRRAGLKTGAFITGYEGSPLGGYDLALGRSKKLLDEQNIHFRPGLNEDLAATAIMGSQIFEVAGNPKVDGVVGIWYGKGPGVDRSGDVFRHANLAGTGTNCAALVLAGDDHGCKSSTIPHQSDFSLYNAGIPFLYPGNAQEIIDYGLYAIAMSRFSGAWTGLKLLTDVCDSGGTVVLDPDQPQIKIPADYKKKVDPRLVPPITLGLEYEVNVRRLEAVLQFARLNRLNRWQGKKSDAKLGIASAGKPYYDLCQALRDLGIGEPELESLGDRVAKFGMTFPLDGEFARDFAGGLETILVIEEKRSFLELHLRDALYASEHHPVILGKVDAQGAPLFPANGELDPDRIALVLGRLIVSEKSRARVQFLEDIAEKPREQPLSIRASNFCSGCPHNRSTLLPEGHLAGGGIGCHTMAMNLTGSGREFSHLTHMGGEGVPWIGMSPFIGQDHMFQNIGDGTYFHSGALAVNALIASGLNITYKILYNGHVSMTGGQQAIGALPVPQLTKKLEAEGVRRTIVLTEDLARYKYANLADNAELRDRSELERTLAELAKERGVTALIYDQECMAEVRRKRSRGKYAEPVKRLMIHPEVCEGCGDCVKQSNCMSLNPVATELGQKMTIHQSSCNKDYSCALGDCPSFVTVKIKPGTGLRRKALPNLPETDVPAPREIAEIHGHYRIVCPGIGGTGVVTINALLATAAWFDGLHVATLDQTGTAQKGGAVVSHILLSRSPIEAPARANAGNADVILGFDLVGVANPGLLRTASPEKTTAVLNTNVTPTIDAIRSHTIAMPERMLEAVQLVTRRGHNIVIDANRLAEGLFGSHLAVNLFLMGVAWQGGLIPLSLGAIEQAIALNGVDSARNLQVFQWGRKYYQDAGSVETLLTPKVEKPAPFDRKAELTAYQNAAYARQYADFVDEVERRAPAIAETVARNLYKLMAYKDEYEVARLLTKPSFEDQIKETWTQVESFSYNLHPPLFRRFFTKKRTFGSWFRWPLKTLASMKFLRGGPLDIFGRTRHRRLERGLIPWYRDLILQALEQDHPQVQELAALPDQIRGYEKLKELSVEQVKKRAKELLLTPQSNPISII
jgi:indolepyruvate ferredoxin oxidoreductase